MTEPIIGNDNACQLAVHSKMRIGITHKNQEVKRVIAPANLFLEREGSHRLYGDGQAQIEDCAASNIRILSDVWIAHSSLFIYIKFIAY